jgi:hypothetical protein
VNLEPHIDGVAARVDDAHSGREVVPGRNTSISLADKGDLGRNVQARLRHALLLRLL